MRISTVNKILNIWKIVWSLGAIILSVFIITNQMEYDSLLKKQIIAVSQAPIEQVIEYKFVDKVQYAEGHTLKIGQAIKNIDPDDGSYENSNAGKTGHIAGYETNGQYFVNYDDGSIGEAGKDADFRAL